MSVVTRTAIATGRLLERFQVNRFTSAAVSDGRREQQVEAAFRYFKWKKLLNLWRVEWQLRNGKTHVTGYPYEWEIDTTNICQLKCPLCHTGLGTIDRNKGVMHFDTYKKVVDEMKDYCIWLTLYSWGEPFLNKRIDEFIAYAHEAEIATTISTNLNKPLTREMAEKIVRSGLDTMIVSIDGVTQEVYEKYRVGGHLDKVLVNLQLLIDTKRELRSKTPYIEWQFIVMRQNQHQIPEARAMSEKMGVDGILFKKVDFPLGEQETDTAQKWMPTGIEEYLRKHPFERPFREEEGERCWRLWRSTVVNWDGGTAPCCYLTNAEDDFGNVSNRSFMSVWNGEDYKSARQLFNIDEEPAKRVGCVTCPVYTGSEAAKARGHHTPRIVLEPVYTSSTSASKEV
jgi:MoaA/NifB/PqqE/SkfB family radical SAM enzyme